MMQDEGNVKDVGTGTGRDGCRGSLVGAAEGHARRAMQVRPSVGVQKSAFVCRFRNVVGHFKNTP
eukprot:60132-Chlamydomonas_euryale.AAC.1